MTENTARTFDWKPRFDEKSLGYKIGVMQAKAGITVRTPRNKSWTRHAWLDQGQEGACTGFSFAQLLACTPKPASGITNADGEYWYQEAKKHDEYPGENYDGSSVLGTMTAGTVDNKLSAYWWATTLEEIDTGLSYYGPMQFGVPWMTGMMTPDAEGWLNSRGQVEGGHAICVAARLVLPSGKVRYRIDNSWGKDWGINGSAYVDADVMRFWLGQQSEFALPRKAKAA